MRGWILALATLCVGCPNGSQQAPEAAQKTKSAAPAKKTKQPPNEPMRKPPPPKPTPAQAWAAAATKHQSWSRTVALLLKKKNEGEALRRPFLEPDPRLQRLAVLTRALLVWDGKRALPMRAVLRQTLKKNPQFDPSELGETSLMTVGLLVLQDPAFLYAQRLVRDRTGQWLSLQRGLGVGLLDDAWAARLLEATDLARQGRWPEAIERFEGCFLELCRRNSKALGDGTLALWQAAEAEFRRTDATLEEVEKALGRWTGFVVQAGKKKR